ncbi:MAG: dfrA [Haloplasmataceae bacterium]|jgi:dihydrofolate reductase|nr:dfrA [Haloplasmataceae bacterium]
MLSIIVAFDKNQLIGKSNIMPWHYKEDLKYFKEKTMGKKVVMGSNTFNSILSYNNKPLPGRKNIVITRNIAKYNEYSDIECFDQISNFLNTYQNVNEEIFIIGGKAIYEQFINYVNRLYITHINKEFEGDTYFPKFNYADFDLINQNEIGELNFCVYERKVKSHE